jgi:putative transposase
MTSKPVAVLLSDLHISQSHSRPHVPNDNLTARRSSSPCHNNEHRHPGIGLHTPASVHNGTATQIQAHRALVLQQAYAASPGRFRRSPKPPRLPARVWINQLPATIETEVTP